MQEVAAFIAEALSNPADDAILAGIETGLLAEPSEIERVSHGTFQATTLGEDIVSMVVGAAAVNRIDEAKLESMANHLILQIAMTGSVEGRGEVLFDLSNTPMRNFPEVVRREDQKRRNAEAAAADITVWRKPKTIMYGSSILMCLKRGINSGYRVVRLESDSDEGFKAKLASCTFTKDHFRLLFHKTYGLFAARVVQSIAASRAGS